MALRKHQAEFSQAIQDKISGADFDTILLRATPGAGKSATPLQAAELIRAGLADRICWIVPREALRTQGERNFLDPFFRKMLNHSWTVRAATNEPRPCRGTYGFVTTYQAVGMDRDGVILNEFRRRRYILILDEFHHCEMEGQWARMIQPLVDQSVFLVLMTGTLQRGDGKPIAFIPYKEVQTKAFLEYQPNIDAPGIRSIEYTRADALAEQSIIPMQFFMHDGSAEWEEGGKLKRANSIANAAPDQASAALYTALRTDYARDLLSKAIDHWTDWRKKIKTAKMLVVCADIDTAREAARQIRKMTNHRSDIATSHESAAARMAIDKFKRGDIRILVTIAMAYEGLDIAEITHIACLTHIRSVPWVEQMIARAVRIDRAYQYRGQVAHIFAPDDPMFRKIVDRIEAEQLPTIDNYGGGKKMTEDAQLSLFSDELDEMAKEEPRINPIGSQITGQREWLYGSGGQAGPDPEPTPEPITPKEQESILRREIEIHVRRFCRNNRVEQRQVNSEIKQHFGKARSDMNNAELALVMKHVKQHYPTGYQVRGRRPPVSKEVEVFHG